MRPAVIMAALSILMEFPIASPKFPTPPEASLASFGALHQWDAEIFGFSRPEAELRQTWDADSSGRPVRMRNAPGAQAFGAIMASGKAYARIPAPALMIVTPPHVAEKWIAASNAPKTQEAARSYYAAIDAATGRQVKAIEEGAPGARVIRIRGAHHIFLSNEAETLRAVRAFLAGLK